MTIGIGYFIGAVAALLYSAMCFYIGNKKPKALFKIAKMKLGKNKSDETVVKFCYVFSVIAFIIAVFVIVLGFVNA